MKNKNWRPLRVLFVGDEPSSRNVCPNTPFVGTPSYKRLLRWIGELDLELGCIKITNKNYIETAIYAPDVIICLGDKAFEHLKIYHNSIIPETIKVFKAPHPSPRNRKFNDPSYEAKMLRELKNWLYS